LTPRPDARSRWLQNIKKRFTKSWDRLFKEVKNSGTSGKALVDYLIAMLVKFTELPEDVVIKTTSEAEGNAIIALFKKSRAKETEWVHWFMYLKYGLYACGGGECRDAMLHSYVHKAVTQPARTKAQARTEQQHLSRAAMSARAHDTQKARDHQKRVIEAKAKAIAKAGNPAKDEKAAALAAHAAVNAHKNMLHEHEMKLSVYDTQLQDLHRELQMYAEEPDLAKECRERWLAMVKQKREWLLKNPPPTLQQAKAVLNEDSEEEEAEVEAEEEEEAEHGVEEGQEEQVEEEEGNEDEGEDLFPDHEEEMEDNGEEVSSPLSPPPPKRPTPAKSKQTYNPPAKRSRVTESEAGQGGGEKCAYALDTCLITQHQCLSWRLKQTGCAKYVCTVCALRINEEDPMRGHWCPAHLSLM